jgi:diguanylate cyclase (GGDEF)-like protein/PAS domain S-box-containing protein
MLPIECRFLEAPTRNQNQKSEPEYVPREEQTILTDLKLRRNLRDLQDSADALREQKEQYQRLIDLSPDMIVVVSGDEVAFLNPTGAEMLGTANPSDIIGQNYRSFVHPDYLAAMEERISESLSSGKTNPFAKSTLIRLDGTPIDVEMRSVRITYDGRPAMLAVIRDVREQKRARSLIQEMAFTDSLTGLPNRRSFHKRLQDAMEVARLAQLDVALMYLYMDNFKLINDSFGHAAGDKLLQQMADRLRVSLPEGAVVSRLGGDEFTIIVPNLVRTVEAVRIAERVVASVAAALFSIDGYDLVATVSMGISMMEGREVDDAELLREADVAMYEAKSGGGNSAILFRPELGDSMHMIRHLELQRGLHEALEAGQFRLVYQPKYDVQSRYLVGIEALLRWDSPDFGAVSPAEFIPVAEDSGLILKIGLWVFDSVCRDVVKWDELGLPPVRVAINLSAKQFQDSSFVASVQEILSAHGLPGHRFEFEITESVLMKHTHQTMERLQALKHIGLQFAIDDFGTGYSSLGYLKRFAIDTLKIDQSFVRDLTSAEDSDEIVSAIIQLAHNLKLQVVAEGVETEAQRQWLAAYGCDAIQGFLMARPMPHAEIAELLGSITSTGCTFPSATV